MTEEENTTMTADDHDDQAATPDHTKTSTTPAVRWPMIGAPTEASR